MSKMKIYDLTGNEQGAVTVSLDAAPVAAKAYAVSIRRLLQQWRQGTVGCKSRGEVSMSNRKPWKQKGTGRARAGTFRSPLWRKGGVIFGPQPRVREICIPKAQRRLALRSVATQMLQDSRVYCLDAAIAGEAPSTKLARQMLAAVKLSAQKVVVFLSGYDTQSYLSFRNLPNVQIVFFDQPNAFDISSGQSWVVLKQDVEQFNEMVARWN